MDPTMVLAAGGGILDWANNELSQFGAVIRAASFVLGAVFVVWQAVKSQMAMARIVVSGLAAGIFVWIVWNVDALQSRVDTEINSAPVAEQVWQERV